MFAFLLSLSLCCTTAAFDLLDLPGPTAECDVAFGRVCRDLSYPVCTRKVGQVEISQRPIISRRQILRKTCLTTKIFIPIYTCPPSYALTCNDGSDAWHIPAVVLSANCRCHLDIVQSSNGPAEPVNDINILNLQLRTRRFSFKSFSFSKYISESVIFYFILGLFVPCAVETLLFFCCCTWKSNKENDNELECDNEPGNEFIKRDVTCGEFLYGIHIKSEPIIAQIV